jgi:4-methyl-5(b-hydroxyethyl)-thiazole monophosphate biosynthesis
MAKVLVLLAHGFEEIEAVSVIDVLRRADVEVTVAAVESDPARGAHGICVATEAPLAAVADQLFDALVLPGGMPGARTLAEHPVVQALIRRHHAAGRLVAAICAAPMALARAGVLAGRQATCYPGCEPDLQGARLVAARVVEDGNLLTSRGPATALDFGLALVRRLCGASAAADLGGKLLV